jgi:spermidine/putrescine transport system ATP-binding protein
MEKRSSKDLSGGEQQRVALARALVNRPKVLLLDEPLGALDLKLRQTMQLELKDIQSEVGITFVYVTHDQGEALTMSDRIGVMNDGRLTQIGTAEDVYESPQNLFVAGFVGEMCLLPAVVTEPGSVKLNGGEVIRARTSSPKGAEVTLTIRPEKLHLYSAASEAPPNRNALKGSIVRRTFYGEAMVYEVKIGLADSIEVRVENIPGMRRWSFGDQVVIDFHPEAAMALSE